MLATIWNTHYKFSRRYGLDDPTTRFLTCVLLFIVLFYVYPLKFLFTLGINDMIFGGSAWFANHSPRTFDLVFHLWFWIRRHLFRVHVALPARVAIARYSRSVAGRET